MPARPCNHIYTTPYTFWPTYTTIASHGLHSTYRMSLRKRKRKMLQLNVLVTISVSESFTVRMLSSYLVMICNTLWVCVQREYMGMYLSEWELHWGTKTSTLCNISCVPAYLIHICQHSPLSHAQSHWHSKTFKTQCWQGFCEQVGDIEIHGAILEGYSLGLEYITNEMISDVDILGVWMVLIILHDWDCWLIITVETVGCLSGHAIFRNEGVDPQGLFVAWATAIYSASMVDSTIMGCFLELHGTTLPSTMKMYPDMECLWACDAQSTSQYSQTPCSPGLPISSMWPFVPFN